MNNEAEKIIDQALQSLSDTSRAASAVAAALRDAGMLTETEWEYGAGYQADNGIEMRWFSMGSGAFTIREAAEREVERFSDAQIRLVHRRRPGPWSPIPEGEPT